MILPICQPPPMLNSIPIVTLANVVRSSSIGISRWDDGHQRGGSEEVRKITTGGLWTAFAAEAGHPLHPLERVTCG